MFTFKNLQHRIFLKKHGKLKNYDNLKIKDDIENGDNFQNTKYIEPNLIHQTKPNTSKELVKTNLPMQTIHNFSFGKDKCGSIRF